jgi:fatty acid-binding protein DegV
MTDVATCLLIDASCDLPEAALKHPQVRLLPVSVIVGNSRHFDDRNPQITIDFYKSNLQSPDVIDARSEPLSVDETTQFLMEHTALNFDRVLGVFIAASRSPITERVKAAMDRVKTSAFTKRIKAKKMVALEQLSTDSAAFFAGYGVQVLSLLDSVAQAQADLTLDAMAQLQRQYAEQTYVYVVPGDVNFILKRAKAKGENSVGMMAGLAAKTLSITPIIRGHKGQTEPVARKRGADNARELLVELARKFLDQNWVTSKHICFSYSGDLAQVQSMPTFQALIAQAGAKGIDVHLALMSMTAAVNVGPNSLSLGILAKPHDAASLL